MENKTTVNLREQVSTITAFHILYLFMSLESYKDLEHIPEISEAITAQSILFLERIGYGK